MATSEDGRRTRSLEPDGAAPVHEQAYLLVLDGGSSFVRDLPRNGAVLIGRSPEAGLQLQDDSVSRRHARITVSDGEAALADLGSHNGTRVNGAAVDGAQALRPGDAVQVGDVTLVFHAAPRAVAPPREEPAPEAVGRLDLGDRVVLVADPTMVQLYERIRRLARSAHLPVLITGETGAGKENAAFAVHHFSARAGRPFVPVHCAALAESLIESELFGHVKGAFTGAGAAKPGLLDRASGGTVFLDEIGEVAPAVQVKLLRAIEAQRITPVGGVEDHAIDVRIVAATHRDLLAEVQAGRFRQDLYYRLCAATVVLPPLRSRPREIELLAHHYLLAACERERRPRIAIAPEALRALTSWRWPGNVRELKNVMQVAAATVLGDRVELADLPEPIREGHVPAAAAPERAEGAGPRQFRPIGEELDELERARMIEALEATGGVQTRAAALIGMPARTFVAKLRQYGISIPRRSAKEP